MATIQPFAALRPDPARADRICELPYDVMSSAEARALAAGNPDSFLRVSKPEIDLPETTDPHAPAVYAKGAENFKELIGRGLLSQDPAPRYYLYRQVMGSHSQLGLVAVASCEEYRAGIIKKHEFTRPDKEDDRVRHLEALRAQTGPVFLTYSAVPVLDALFARIAGRRADVDFTAPDGIRHTSWAIGEAGDIDAIRGEFKRVPSLYIADGHHRSAAADRVCRTLGGAGASAFFLAVIFPHNQMQILPYNRVVRDLNGHTPVDLLERLDGVFVVQENGSPRPTRRHEIGFYMNSRWWTLNFRPEFASSRDPLDRLDVSLLQKLVLDPLLDIRDPRTSDRIAFVGGIRGTGELEKLVNSDEYACAFSMFPTGLEELMAIADAGGVMPPKSTWFEPKLRDGMFCHLF